MKNVKHNETDRWALMNLSLFTNKLIKISLINKHSSIFLKLPFLLHSHYNQRQLSPAEHSRFKLTELTLTFHCVIKKTHKDFGWQAGGRICRLSLCWQALFCLCLGSRMTNFQPDNTCHILRPSRQQSCLLLAEATSAAATNKSSWFIQPLAELLPH